MNSYRWQRLQELFHSASEIDASRRERFLEEACPDDEELRRQALSLALAADEEKGSLSDLVAETAVMVQQSGEPQVGTRLGPYRIDGSLGRGGMGSVYLASRADDQFRKQVAIKVMGRGLATEEMVRRFRAERQILATLDHPNIARLLDGGVSD
jgi:eukaryotic-like serine/threonine-protein kinase